MLFQSYFGPTISFHSLILPFDFFDCPSVLLLGIDGMITATLFKESIQLGAGLQFRGVVHCHHGRKHGGRQEDMVMTQ